MLFETLWQDLGFGARRLSKKPGFSAIVVLTLARGVGANTAIFSGVNAVLLRPLPFADPDELIAVGQSELRRLLQTHVARGGPGLLPRPFKPQCDEASCVSCPGWAEHFSVSPATVPPAATRPH